MCYCWHLDVYLHNFLKSLICDAIQLWIFMNNPQCVILHTLYPRALFENHVQFAACSEPSHCKDYLSSVGYLSG